MIRLRPLLIALIGIIALVALDQGIKYWVEQTMALHEEIPLLPFLSLLHARNPGVAFSMLSSFPDFGLIVLSLAIIAFVAFLWWKTKPDRKLARLGFLLVIGGAVGNLIDRVRFHYVIDYIYFHIGDVFSFAIFNLADAFITIGAVLIIADELFAWVKERKHKKT